ncbi:MAG: glycosyltransferase family 4 protein [Bacteroidota bacterium]|nr:glycosyltransferase family 4 protein [Bacteroidota bacterium]
MKILFIHNNYASNNSGEEHASKGLANLLTKNGHTVEWYRKSSDIIDNKLKMKIAAFFLGIYNPKAVKELKKIILHFEPDIIQVQNLYPFISPAILPLIKRLNIPIVMRCPNYRLFCPTGLHLSSKGEICEKCVKGSREFNGILNNCEKNWIKSIGYAIRNFTARTIWKLNKNMDAYIVQSNFQKQKFIVNGIDPEKLFIVPGLTPKIVSSSTNQIGDYVSFIGRGSLEKGIIEFLEVAKLLPKIKFAIAGSLDPKLTYLKNKSSKNVLWCGFLNGKKYDEFYQKSKIIVVPSKWYEGFPNIITRAMQHAKPVITSNIGAMESIIEHNKNGILVSPGNIQQLKNAVKNLYMHDDKCIILGKQAQKKCLKYYNDKEVYKSLLNAYAYAFNKSNKNIMPNEINF